MPDGYQTGATDMMGHILTVFIGYRRNNQWKMSRKKDREKTLIRE